MPIGRRMTSSKYPSTGIKSGMRSIGLNAYATIKAVNNFADSGTRLSLEAKYKMKIERFTLFAHCFMLFHILAYPHFINFSYLHSRGVPIRSYRSNHCMYFHGFSMYYSFPQEWHRTNESASPYIRISFTIPHLSQARTSICGTSPFSAAGTQASSYSFLLMP